MPGLFSGPSSRPPQILRKRLSGALTGPGYGAAVRLIWLIWETSRPLSFAVAGAAIAASVLPTLVLIAAGQGSQARHLLYQLSRGPAFASGGWPAPPRSVRVGQLLPGSGADTRPPPNRALCCETEPREGSGRG